MTQNFTPNDLIKNLYEPQEGLNQILNSEERSELASFQQVKKTLDQSFLEPSEKTIGMIVAYSKGEIAR